mgnify:CR=1 FL=1
MATLLEKHTRPEPGKIYLLKEHFSFCEDGICKAQSQFLTEQEKVEVKENGSIFLTGVAQRADAKNGNGRIYPRKTLEREVQNYQQLIKENRAYGELDHPEETVINLSNASHIVRDIWWNGSDVMIKIQILRHHPKGQIVEGILKDGGAIGLSSRGLGSVAERPNGVLMVEDDLQLICFDIVSEPSTHGAFMNLMEAKKPLIEAYQKSELFSKEYKVNRLLNEILEN